MRDERVSALQVVALVLVSRITLTVVYFGTPPGIKQDVWWQSFLAALMGILFAWVLHFLWVRSGGQGFAHAAETALGRRAGRLLLLLYGLFFWLMLSLNLRLMVDFFLYAFLPRTPPVVLLSVTAALALWGARAGAEVLGRAAEVVAPLLMGTIVLMAVLLVPDIRAERLLPFEIVVTGPVPHLKDTVSVAARTVELVWVGLLPVAGAAPHRLAFRAVAWAQVLQGVIWVIMSVALLGTLGRELEVHLFPFYRALRLISIADFIERIDAIILAVWLFGMMIRTGMLLWAAAVCGARACGLKSYRPITAALVGLAVTYSLVQAKSLPEVQGYLAPETFAPFTLLFVLVIPALLLGVLALRGRLRTG